MRNSFSLGFALLLTLVFGSSVFADEKTEAAPEAAAADDVESVGTKAFDATTVNEMFEKLKKENERLAEQEAPHLTDDGLEVIELAPINVDPYEVRNLDLLIERLDPQPRRRLERLAAIDPAAAADIQVTMRAEERFFAGEMDPGDRNAGGTVNVDARKIGSSVTEAIKRAKASMRQKKATDDQAEIPTSEE